MFDLPRTPADGVIFFFFFNDTATTEIYTLSLHDALPISFAISVSAAARPSARGTPSGGKKSRSEEHTSELQSRLHLVCRLLLEKKKEQPRRQHDLNTAGEPGSELERCQSRATTQRHVPCV